MLESRNQNLPKTRLDLGLKASFLMASKVFPTSSNKSFFTKVTKGAPSTWQVCQVCLTLKQVRTCKIPYLEKRHITYLLWEIDSHFPSKISMYSQLSSLISPPISHPCGWASLMTGISSSRRSALMVLTCEGWILAIGKFCYQGTFAQFIYFKKKLYIFVSFSIM